MRGRDVSAIPTVHAPVTATGSVNGRSQYGMPRPTKSTDEPLARYREKRDFTVTSEPSDTPRATRASTKSPLQFVIQKHWASRLHFDLRLQVGEVMASWALPQLRGKGWLSFDPAVKAMAIQGEDHPISYNQFEGTIPAKQYGAGTVIIWDRGTYEPIGDAAEGIAKGKLAFMLHGEKLAGLWELVRISKPGEKKQDQWLFFKKRGDAWARPADEYDVVTALPDSVIDKPLGRVEDREPRERAPGTAAKSTLAVDLSAAVKARLPSGLEPQLATLAARAPANGQWLVESKFDGYRMLARIEGDDVKLFTRNGHDWTAKLKSVAEAIRQLGITSALLDGEILVVNEAGIPDFNALQNAIDNSRSAQIQYFVFDVPYLAGEDLRRVPLFSRRTVLRKLLEEGNSERVRFSETFDASPEQMLKAACDMGLEGIILKRADAPYVSSRTDTWLKLKCQRRQEFVVVGFVDRANSKSEVGSLLLAYYDDRGALTYAGAVGTGWNTATGHELHLSLAKLEVPKPPLDPASVKPGRWSKRSAGSERWVKPTMVVEVGFGEWTPDGHVRHPTFKGVRLDKQAREVKREAAVAPPEAPTGRAAARPSAVKITNADRGIDASSGLTKGQLVRYYESIADFILPHLKDRPVSLVRAPEGVSGEQFFQKHVEGTKMPGLRALDPALWPGHAPLLAIDTAEALVSAAQMNVVELHTLNSTTQHIDEPDRVVFDLDPGEGVSWSHLQEAAQLMHGLLGELALKSWLKTSGGKGLHIVVPLAPKLDYDIVKDWSQAVVTHMAKTIPQRFVAKSGGSNRVGKIFIDYLRNGRRQTTATAFSARVRPGLGVSMPVGWEQLPALKAGNQWNITTAREYLSFQRTDPWAEYWKCRQTLTKAMKVLGLSKAR